MKWKEVQNEKRKKPGAKQAPVPQRAPVDEDGAGVTGKP
jgi:hypothetical protein